ncbi:MAG: ribonuclease III domain-containing protein [Cyanobacteriota bacterium]|nr:ribonuclease III domain-containing protein [Cyanobacteriota bacterium]
MSAIPPENSASNLPQSFPEAVYFGDSIGDRVRQISPAALAYLGDAVYELLVRSQYVLPPKRIQDYHRQVVEQVRAETQARHLQSLEPYLSDRERDIIRRGRNAAFGRPKRVSARIYQQATSLETLVGYLYLTDPQRLQELLTYLEFDYEPTIPQTRPENRPETDSKKFPEDCQPR